MELISRMMDGSISYDPENRLEPVTSGPGARQEDKIERLKEVPIFEGCSQRQLQSVAIAMLRCRGMLGSRSSAVLPNFT
jgi:hypothetical protein